jgi:hypothetical protein
MFQAADKLREGSFKPGNNLVYHHKIKNNLFFLGVAYSGA